MRAQADIDMQPEQFKTISSTRFPSAFAIRSTFGVSGSVNVVPQPYTRAMFEKTQA